VEGSTTRVERYTGRTPNESLQAFSQDSARASAVGFHPVAQRWDGPTLTVTYQWMPSAPPPPTWPSPLPYNAGRDTNWHPHERAEPQFGAIAVVVGGALMGLGSILPWATATGPFGLSISKSGIEGGDGLITIVLGIAIAIIGLGMVRGATEVQRVLAIVGSLVALAVVALNYSDIESRLSDLGNSGSLVYGSVGIGIWLIGIGSVVALIATFTVTGRSRNG